MQNSKHACSILVVDDDTELLDLVDGMLSAEGYQVQTAQSGNQAISILSKAGFCAVISDIDMPGLSGLALSQFIFLEFPALPVLLITGKIWEFAHQIPKSDSRLSYLAKPFTRNELFTALRGRLEYSGDHCGCANTSPPANTALEDR